MSDWSAQEVKGRVLDAQGATVTFPVYRTDVGSLFAWSEEEQSFYLLGEGFTVEGEDNE